MGRYKKANEFELNEEQKKAIAYHENVQGGHMTNMKYTLLRDLKSFESYMSWYDLQKGLQEFLSEREFVILCYAISSGNDCLVCGTFFRKVLIDSGEDPENLTLSEKEEALWNFSRALVKDFHNIPEVFYLTLEKHFDETQMIKIIAFAGQMFATNIFVTAAKVDLDEILFNYRKY